MSLVLTRGSFDATEAAAVARVLHSGWTSQGREVAALEQEWAEACGVGHAVALSSCTAALHLAARLTRPRHVPATVASLTFVAGPDVLRAEIGWPRFEDCGEDCLAHGCYLATHYAGQIARVAEGGIEDAAHCYPGQAGVGAGRAQCWSLHGTKIITCGEGGMLTTDEEPLAREARLMRRHGIEALASGAREASYDVALRGDNWAMDDIRAAIVRVQLRRLEQLLAWRREAFEAYRDRLGGMLIDSPSYHLAVVRLPHGTDRAAVRARLTERGIATSVHYPPVHMLTSYRWERMAYQPGLPVTEDLAPRLLTLPLHAEMTPGDAEAVAEEVLSCVR